jgi:hypothetical protein
MGLLLSSGLHKLEVASAQPVDPDVLALCLRRSAGAAAGSLAGKWLQWLQLLTEIAPGVKRAAAIFNPDTAPVNRSYYLPSFEQTARSLKVESITALVHSDAEIAGWCVPGVLIGAGCAASRGTSWAPIADRLTRLVGTSLCPSTR